MTHGPHDNRVHVFLTELNGAIASHSRSGRWDAFLLQALVIGAAVAGFASLYAGTIGKSAEWAGVIGGLTSVATILSQQLHCVKAVNWHARMVTELDGIRLRLLNEFKPSPTEDELAEMSEKLRALRVRMADEWEKVINQHPPKLDPKADKKPRHKAQSEA